MGVEIAFVAEADSTYGVFIRDTTGNLIEIFEEEGNMISTVLLKRPAYDWQRERGGWL